MAIFAPRIKDFIKENVNDEQNNQSLSLNAESESTNSQKLIMYLEGASSESYPNQYLVPENTNTELLGNLS